MTDTGDPGEMSASVRDWISRSIPRGFRVTVVQGVAPGILPALAQRGLGEDFEIYFVEQKRSALQHAWEQTAAQPWQDRILFFQGGLREFARAFGAAPSLVIAADAGEVLSLWVDLPSNARVFVRAAEPGLRQWERAGWIERISAAEDWTLFQTGARHAAAEHPTQPAAFQSLRASLHAFYFQPGAAPPAPATGAAASVLRRPGRDEARSPEDTWPWQPAPRAKLPDHLPDGSQWPLLSVVTPSFQQGQYIEETILSVAHQNYPRIEHIVIDGASTDQTAEILKRHRHRLAAAVSEKDRGQSHAINKGMRLAGGEILTWLNSDDCLAPDALAGVALAFHLSGADIVAGAVDLMAGGTITGRHLTSCDPGPLPLEDLLDLDGGWNAGKFFYQPEVMFTRSIWDKAGGSVREDLYYSMDYDLWVRFAQAGARLHVIGRSVARFRVHEGQKTNAEEQFKQELREYRDAYNKATHRPPPPAVYTPPARDRLKIVMLNDHGYEYGAGIAHKRTAQSLSLAGHQVQAIALRSSAGDGTDDGGLSAIDVMREVAQLDPDLVIAGNLHSAAADPWILGSLASKYPTHCVLHDFWLITGRCPYPAGCTQYLSQCTASCPTADEYPGLPPVEIAPAHRRKLDILFARNHLALLANSDWTASIASQAMASAARPGAPAPVARFRLSFPLDVFRPLDKTACRKKLGLPEDRFIVMISGDVKDKRKRAQLSFEALRQCGIPNLTAIATGWTPPEADTWLPDVRRTGHIHEPETLAQYYSAADLYISPSSAETFGQVFLEAIACGTPAIGFANSGIEEAVLDGVTGLLVRTETAAALAAAIRELYERADLRNNMAAWGRLYVENEWSPEAAYYHMFRAWRSLGLLARWGLPPKINLLAGQPEAAAPSTILPQSALSFHDFQMGGLEGPYPDFNLDKFRWAYGPSSEFVIHSPRGMKCTLVLRCRNLHDRQRLKILVGGEKTLDTSLPVTGIARDKLLCAPVHLQQGRNKVRLEFAAWATGGNDPRPLAAVISGLHCIPEPGS